MAVAQRAMTAREWGLLALLSLLWGGSFFFIGVAVKELPPLTLAGLRVGLADVVYFRILSGAGATNVLLVTLVAPATSMVLGALFLHERLLARQFLGFALIALGLAFIDGRLPRALSGANPDLAPHNSR